MAELVIEKRLAGPTQPGTSTTVLFTVPTDHVYVIKQIVICNPDTVTRTLSLAVGTAATPANRFFSELVVAASETVTVDTQLVLAAGETVQAISSAVTTITVTITGWDHQLV